MSDVLANGKSIKHAYFGNKPIKMIFFEDKLIFPDEKHHLFLTAVPSNLGTTRGSGYYKYFDNVTISAIPNEYCTFEGWSDGGIVTPYTVQITGDMDISAFFDREHGTAYFLRNY